MHSSALRCRRVRRGRDLLLAALLALATVTALLPAAAAPAQAADRSNKVLERRTIGTSVQGRPIYAYRKGNPRSGRKVVVFGQMHGNERAGVTTARYLRDHVAVSLAADLWIIPTINPDGYAANTRTNAHKVDLNRNFPNYWVREAEGTSKYSGPRAASEPETRAVMAFLAEIKPVRFASLHQPLRGIGRAPKNAAFQKRLAHYLNLPRKTFSVCRSNCGAPGSPTMTDWFNRRFAGTGITVEFSRSPSPAYRRGAARAIARALLAY
jgi:succinylglutamate desuccinylase